MSLIALNTIAAEAEANGFQVTRTLLGRGGHGIELIPPGYDGPTAHWHNGACYGSVNVISIYDRTSYGYNDCFHGPWHDGYVQSDDFALNRLYQHPAMRRRAQEAA